MRRRRPATDRVLRWYPPAWRARYGDELLALIDDETAAGGPTRRLRASLAWSGLRERANEAALAGDGRPAADRVRAGSLLVLGAWSAFVLAGLSFTKASEHFAASLPAAARHRPQGAFDVVAALGACGAVIVALGTISAVPAFARFVHRGGWRTIRRHVRRATVLSVIAAGTLLLLSAWAHRLDPGQRNGGDAPYALAVATWALLAGASLAQWTAAGIAAARRIDLSPSVLRLEARLALALAAAMTLATAATGLWWGAMAADAPWFLAGTAPGTRPSPVTPQLVLTLGLMLAATSAAAYGVSRIATAAPQRAARPGADAGPPPAR